MLLKKIVACRVDGYNIGVIAGIVVLNIVFPLSISPGMTKEGLNIAGIMIKPLGSCRPVFDRLLAIIFQ